MNTTRDPIFPDPLEDDATKEELKQWRIDITNILKTLHNDVYDDFNGSSDYLDTLRDSIIPIGFIYTQLPGKDTPATVFGFGTWENVSDEFAGNFFRVEGGEAEDFEGGEQAFATALPTTPFVTGNQSANHVHAVTGGSHNHTVNIGSEGAPGYSMAYRGYSFATTFATGASTHTHTVGNQSASHTHTVTTGGDAETRPVNETIRIWERTA